MVDDASTDGTSEIIKERFPNVIIVQGTGYLYWNRGMHLAWKTASEHADYDFFIWLNDDTFIFHNALIEMMDCSKVAGQNAIICGSTLSQKNNQHTYGGKTLDGKMIIPNGTLQKCEIIQGNFVLISKSIYAEVGNIDEVFPHAIGDHDYGLRAIKKGFNLFIAQNYIGYCEEHEKLPKWCLSEVPFTKRIKSLYSPLGNAHPKYYFIYEKRHFGLLIAVKHFASIHLRLLIPQLWK